LSTSDKIISQLKNRIKALNDVVNIFKPVTCQGHDSVNGDELLNAGENLVKVYNDDLSSNLP
jgi:hypothetical protein